MRAEEDILLEAEATSKLGVLSQFGAGRAYLTSDRIIWIRRGTPILRPLLFWIPDVVTIERTSIDRVRMVRELTRAWLTIDADGKTYAFRLGKGPYPTLRDNPRTIEEWLRAFEGVTHGATRLGDELTAQEKSPQNRAGIFLTLLAIVSTPFWLIGFLLSGAPVVLFVVMGLLAVMALVAGLILSRG